MFLCSVAIFFFLISAAFVFSGYRRLRPSHATGKKKRYRFNSAPDWNPSGDAQWRKISHKMTKTFIGWFSLSLIIRLVYRLARAFREQRRVGLIPISTGGPPLRRCAAKSMRRGKIVNEMGGGIKEQRRAAIRHENIITRTKLFCI